MKIHRGKIICLVLLLLLIGCVDSVLGSPVFQYMSLRFQYLTLPKYREGSGDVLWEKDTQPGYKQLLLLSWSEEDIVRLKTISPNNELQKKYSGGVLSPSGNTIVTFSFEGARVRDPQGNLITDVLIPAHDTDLRVYFRSDEQEIAFTGSDKTSIWTRSDDQVITIVGWEVLGYGPDERFLVAAGGDYGTIAILDREQVWKPKFLVEYDRIKGFTNSSDQKYLLTYGCTDGVWFESGFFCFHGFPTLWDTEGKKVADFTSQDEVELAGFTTDMEHVVTKGCDRLLGGMRPLSEGISIPVQVCLGKSTRYYDLQGNLEGIRLGQN